MPLSRFGRHDHVCRWGHKRPSTSPFFQNPRKRTGIPGRVICDQRGMSKLRQTSIKSENIHILTAYNKRYLNRAQHLSPIMPAVRTTTTSYRVPNESESLPRYTLTPFSPCLLPPPCLNLEFPGKKIVAVSLCGYQQFFGLHRGCRESVWMWTCRIP